MKFNVGDKVKSTLPNEDRRQRTVLEVTTTHARVSALKPRIRVKPDHREWSDEAWDKYVLEQGERWVIFSGLSLVKYQLGDFIIGTYGAVEFAHTNDEAEAAWIQYRPVVIGLLGRNAPSKREFLAGWFFSNHPREATSEVDS